MRISTAIDIDAPAEAVWDVVGPRFGDVGTWARAVHRSTVLGVPGEPGSGRSCEVAAAGFDALTEELVRYDDGARTLTYQATSGMPRFVRWATNTWRVGPLPGGRSRFVMSAELMLSRGLRVLSPVLAGYLWGIGRRTARDLKTYVETGSPRARRRALDRLVRVNATFSAACGALLLAGPGWWATQLGDPPPILLAGVGASLLGYALVLGLAARRPVPAGWGRAVAVLDAGWVLVTAALLLAAASAFSATGVVAVVGTGLLVATLGLLQWRVATMARTSQPVPAAPNGGRLVASH